MVCLFCLKETNDGILLYGTSEPATKARSLIAKHFWFDINEVNQADKYACSNCWPKVVSFHEFYDMVEANYKRIPIVFDSTMDLVSPLLDCESEKFFNNKTVENNEPEVGAVFVSPLDLNGVNKKQNKKVKSKALQQISNSTTKLDSRLMGLENTSGQKQEIELLEQNPVELSNVTIASIYSSKSKPKSSKLTTKTGRPPGFIVRKVEQIECFMCNSTLSPAYF